PKFEPRLSLRIPFFLHNAILSLSSGILLIAMLATIFPIVRTFGAFYSICHYEVFDQMELYFFINYLFKYYELIDTIFLLLKGKDVPFLHWFHHSMTLILCHSQLWGRTSVSWVPIVLNLLVHVL